MKIVRRLMVVAACTLAAACASAGANPKTTRGEPATVLVDNQSFVDMTVYVLRGAQRVRLGLATGLSKTRFTLPRGFVFAGTSLRFVADPIGGAKSPVSEEITVGEGEEIELRIPPG